MKDDFKNVIISFGLIALVFSQGSLIYQKKLYNEYVTSTELKNKNSIANSSNTPPKAVPDNNIVVKKPTIQPIKNSVPAKKIPATSNVGSSNQQAIDAANLIAQQNAAKALADAQAQAQAQAQALADQKAQAAINQQAQINAQTAPSQSRVSRAS